MKKLILGFFIIFALSTAPVLAAASPAKTIWKPLTPKGYAPITWASAPGIASFYKAPANSGAIDFLTRIYLPQNQINLIISTTSPVVLIPGGADSSVSTTASSSLDFSATSSAPTSVRTSSDLALFPNLAFTRIVPEAAKTLDRSIKFLWDISFFNMKAGASDLSLAAKYTFGTTTTITSGSRSVPDMQQPRRMLIIDNQTGTATIADFNAAVFADSKSGDQAVEGFSPAVAKTDSASAAASRLFIGVSPDSQELLVYCSQSATVKEASDALTAAGAPLSRQLEADGGASAACGYALPGQFFVEPTRTLPLLMGAKTILARGKVTTKTMNVRSGPGTKYPIVAHLSKGAAIIAYEITNGWYRIGVGEWALGSLIK